MKKIISVFIIAIACASVAHADCPTGYEEIQMENITLTESGGQCSGDAMAYYQIDELCNANIIENAE